jgi:hypothetical protein
MKYIIESVLQCARSLVADGLAGNYADCERYCPWCAIACAKSILGVEFGTLALQHETNEHISREQALDILDRALARVT